MDTEQVQLHRLCRSCKHVFQSSKVFRGSRRCSMEQFDLHDSVQQLNDSIEQGCHFCTHIRLSFRSVPPSAVDTSSDFNDLKGKLVLQVSRASTSSSTDEPTTHFIVRLEPGAESVTPSIERKLYASYSAGSAHAAHKLWKAPITIPHAAQSAVSTSSTQHMELIRHWLDTCERHHVECRNKLSLRARSPTRLICIDGPLGLSSVRLVDSRSHDYPAYCCLSHRWGTGESITLTMANIADFKHSIATDRLPQSFRDAILITKNLGISYLWIDSLCIIQDSEEDWYHEASLMGDIFEGAACTIAAAGSEDNNGGCFARRNPLEVSKCRILKSLIYVHGDDDSLLNIAEATRDTPLSRRGWIFQERLLSRRTLSFGKRGVFWSCAYGMASEQDPEGWGLSLGYSATVKKIFGDEISTTQCQKWPLGLSFHARSFYFALLHIQGKALFEHDHEALYCFHRDWMNIVAAYTRCELTRPSDRLVALRGIAVRIARSIFTSNNYEYGVWRPSLLFDLLWYCPTTSEPSSLDRARKPSWSWGGINTPVRSAAIDFLLPNTAVTYTSLAKLEMIELELPPRTIIAGTGVLWEADISGKTISQSERAKPMPCSMFLDHDRVDSNTSQFFFPLLATVQFCGGLLLSTRDGRKYKRIGFARCKSAVIGNPQDSKGGISAQEVQIR